MIGDPIGIKRARCQLATRAMFEALNRAIAFHEMRPVVDRVFAFDELGAALTYLSAGRHFGKICLRA